MNIREGWILQGDTRKEIMDNREERMEDKEERMNTREKWMHIVAELKYYEL